MAVAEADIELLETYLDGELSPHEARELEERLQRDPRLAMELDELRAERAMRAAVWHHLEGDDRTVAQVQSNLDRALLREQVREATWRRRSGALRWVGAAAASIVIGIGLGWTGRALMDDNRTAPGPSLASGPAPAVTVEGGGYRVALTDEAGNIVAVQRFDSLEAARQFTVDLRQWQQRREQVRTANVVLVGDRF